MSNLTTTTPEINYSTLETVLVKGDLKDLTSEQRVDYYRRVCESIGLNPLTKPFDYLNLSGKLVLYAKRDCADQLRRIYGISVQITARETIGDVYVVSARAHIGSARTDESTGAVSIKGLSGENLANAYMKAETKAKRRVTLSIAGLGVLDETEVDSINGAHAVNVDQQTGEIIEGRKPIEAPKPQASKPATAAPAAATTAISPAQRQELANVMHEQSWSVAEFKALLARHGVPAGTRPTLDAYSAIMLDLKNPTIHDQVAFALNLETDPLGVGQPVAEEVAA